MQFVRLPHPADERHSYGHGKIENVSGTIEAVLILIAAFWILLEAVKKILYPNDIKAVGWGIMVMAVSGVVNFFISRYLMKVGIETDSIALKADAMHLRTDVLTSFGVMAGLVGIYLTGWHWLDPLAAMLVAALIVHAAWELLKESFAPLLDTSLPKDEEEQIKNAIEKHSDSFIDFHSLRTRKAGSERHVDFHLTVCRYHTIEHAHDLADKIEEAIQKEFKQASILIHHEPCMEKCESCNLTCKI